ncbi:hypothetical protein SpCBS45565_g05970 [Spizellomyces sp. 'palustris']|nr:hypothetical protein SpCBS45565_g05970 [Spizellomyces sp. 'palustris']
MNIPRQHTATITVKGMTCGSCVRTIESQLRPLPGVSSVVVSLDEELATVMYDADLLDEKDLLNTIEECGFEAMPGGGTKEVVVSVQGMTCQSCVKTVTGVVKALPGVESAVVDLASESATVKYDGGLLSPEDLVAAIEGCGFDAALQQNGPNKETPASEHYDISVKGMVCQSCVKTITAKLSPMVGVKTVKVDLETENASVEIDTAQTNVLALIDAIEECGFDASLASTFPIKTRPKPLTLTTVLKSTLRPSSPDPRTSLSLSVSSPLYTATTAGPIRTVQIEVQGMTCASCVATIEKHLRSNPGVVSCKVALLAERAEVQFKELLMTEEQVANLIDDIGFRAKVLPSAAYGTIDLKIFGMTCGSCSGKIERELNKMDGVQAAAVNLLGQSGRFQFDSSVIGVRDIVEKIESLGFTAFLSDMGSNAQVESLERTREIQEWRSAFWRSLKFAIPVTLLSMILPMTFVARVIDWEIVPGLSLGNLTMLILTIPVQFGIGQRFYRATFKALSHGSYTMDVLITLGTSVAFAFSVASIMYSICLGGHPKPQVFFETCTTLITFITLGRFLENLAKGKTSSALSKLISLAPTKALLLSTDPSTGQISEKEIPTEYVQAGDLLKVIPGERVPADGVVEYGSTSIDEALVTGEPLPVGKKVGDGVIGGTVNGSGVIHMRAVRVGADATLAQIVKLVNEAQTSKAPIQNIADTVAGYFVPAVIVLGLATFFVWIIILNATKWIPPSFPEGSSVVFVCLSMCISVIVVACPCALGLATPTAVMVGTGVGAQLGILIKGGGPLETAHRVTKFVFDKTGTLTMGKLEVVTYQLFADDLKWNNEAVFFGIVGAAEANSEHPLGKAIAKHGKEVLDVRTFPHVVETFEAVMGSGVQCTVTPPGGKPVHVLIGNQSFLSSNKCSPTPQGILDSQRTHESHGHTVIFVAFNQMPVGLIALADTLKPAAPPTIAALKKMGVQVCMVTGDQYLTALSIARQCGIPTSSIHAGVTPSGKKSLVTQFQADGHVVAMVGDGVNDSASLAQADMGIAVYGGTDVAVEAASVVLMRDELGDVVTAIDLSRVIFRRIRMNFLWATIYNILMIPLAMGIFSPWGITLPAMIAGMAMSLSSVSVVVSSLLLKFYKPPKIFTSTDILSNDVDLEASIAEPRTSGAFVEGVRELLHGSPKRGYLRVMEEEEEDGEVTELLERVELA